MFIDRGSPTHTLSGLGIRGAHIGKFRSNQVNCNSINMNFQDEKLPLFELYNPIYLLCRLVCTEREDLFVFFRVVLLGLVFTLVFRFLLLDLVDFLLLADIDFPFAVDFA